MQRVTKLLRSGLAMKLAIYLVVSTGAIFLVFGVTNIRMHRSHAEALLRQHADSVSDLIQRSTRYHMLRNDRDAIDRTVADIGSQPGINKIRITNRDGIVRYSNQTAEIGTRVRQASPPAATSRPRRWRSTGSSPRRCPTASPTRSTTRCARSGWRRRGPGSRPTPPTSAPS